ncbi:hypothetical protein [Alteromonas macleodii]|uniref:hypothetical protein n=1 Tax=Alteromonas macleodii TaxID=28108 RepID=UPI0006909C73|nr:hypothetical protein [Alteromonas macleodii]
MNVNQIDQVRQQVTRLESFNLAKQVALKFKEYPSLNGILIEQFSIEEYVECVERLRNEFAKLLDSPLVKVVPFSYNFNNELGNSNLNSDLANLASNISNLNFPQSVAALKRLIHFLVVNGMWNTQDESSSGIALKSLARDKKRLEVVSNHLEEATSSLGTLMEGIEQGQSRLNNFIKAKTKELDEIESLLSTARHRGSEIEDIRTDLTGRLERAISLVEQAEERRSSVIKTDTEMKQLLEAIKESLNGVEEISERKEAEYNELVRKFEDSVSKVESKREYFDERNQYLNDLIGREVGASLFETFKQRKEEFKTPIIWWGIAIPFSAIVTIFWIYTLFGDGDLAQLSWQIFLVNTFKALPAVGLLVFTISQYAKERNFQEEYAFKSAVALTINSYAEQLSDKASKDQMILDSVGKIYQSPMDQKKLIREKEQGIQIDELRKLITDFFKSKE